MENAQLLMYDVKVATDGSHLALSLYTLFL